MPASQTDHQKARDLILQSMSKSLDEEMDKLVDDSYVAALPFPTRESDNYCQGHADSDTYRCFVLVSQRALAERV